jgi:hypothetical protein
LSEISTGNPYTAGFSAEFTGFPVPETPPVAVSKNFALILIQMNLPEKIAFWLFYYRRFSKTPAKPEKTKNSLDSFHIMRLYWEY